MKKGKMVIIMLCMLTFIFVTYSSPVFAYNRGSAVNYADTYAYTRNPSFRNFNTNNAK